MPKASERVLSIEEMELIYVKSLLNAKELYSDATLLLENNRFARAHFLLRISNEELGKCALLLSMQIYLHQGKAVWKKFWISFRNHQAKSELTETMQLVLSQSGYKAADLGTIKAIIPVIEKYKKTSLYADYVDDDEKVFLEPREVISKSTAESLHELTSRAIAIFEPLSVASFQQFLEKL